MVDTHCHLEFAQYDEDRAEVIEQSRKDLSALINVGTSLEGSRRAIELSKKFDFIYASVGLHPHEAVRVNSADFPLLCQEFGQLLRYKKVVGIGETGLDYHGLGHDNKVVQIKQKELFRFQLGMAIEHQLPVIIHNRNAWQDILFELKRYLQTRSLIGVFHCFSEDLIFAKKILDLGFYLSFTGILTFKSAQKVREVAKQVPLNKILLETDAPFLAPEPYRGGRCEPWMVKYVADQIALLKGVSAAKVRRVTTQNAINLFGLPAKINA